MKYTDLYILTFEYYALVCSSVDPPVLLGDCIGISIRVA